MPRPTTTALIVAAGRGTRAGGDVPKQFRLLAGRSVLARAAAAFAEVCGEIVVVAHPDERDRTEAEVPGAIVITGGATRTDSVRAGLAAVTGARVLIHDAARPGVTAAVIGRVMAALDDADGAAPALRVTDALWQGDGFVDGVRDRTGLWRAQTPQGFRTGPIRAAYAAHPGPAADDVEVARAAGLRVAIVDGDEALAKITGPEDHARMERAMAGDAMDVRLGNGFDVHAFGPGDAVTLCGVTVPHERGLVGHSDADVGLHAIADAIYGALAEGDIGRHFPPSEARWKGADSAVFLEHAGGRVAARGYRVANVDATLICEAPKIGPHADAMRARVAAILGVEADRVSVKATTTERLGFAGRGEGIACSATAALVRA